MIKTLKPLLPSGQHLPYEDDMSRNNSVWNAKLAEQSRKKIISFLAAALMFGMTVGYV